MNGFLGSGLSTTGFQVRDGLGDQLARLARETPANIMQIIAALRGRKREQERLDLERRRLDELERDRSIGRGMEQARFNQEKLSFAEMQKRNAALDALAAQDAAARRKDVDTDNALAASKAEIERREAEARIANYDTDNRLKRDQEARTVRDTELTRAFKGYANQDAIAPEYGDLVTPVMSGVPLSDPRMLSRAGRVGPAKDPEAWAAFTRGDAERRDAAELEKSKVKADLIRAEAAKTRANRPAGPTSAGKNIDPKVFDVAVSSAVKSGAAEIDPLSGTVSWDMDTATKYITDAERAYAGAKNGAPAPSPASNGSSPAAGTSRGLIPRSKFPGYDFTKESHRKAADAHAKAQGYDGVEEE